MNKNALVITSLLASSFVFADDKLKSEAELGLILTNGNTTSTILKGKLDIKHDLSNWRMNYIFDALFNEDQIFDADTNETTDVTTAEKYFASVQADYKLGSKDSSLFIYASRTNDRFSGFDFQDTLSVGYSNTFFRNDRSYLKYDIGPGYSRSRSEGVTEETAIIRVAFDYEYNFSDSAKFSQTVSSDFSPDTDINTKTKAESAVLTQIAGSLSLKVSLTIDNNSIVADNVEHTDTQTSASIIYTF